MREEKQGKRDPVWRSASVWLLMAAVLTVSWILAYTLVTGQIIDTSVRGIEELARHDEQAIVANLRNKWYILSGIGRGLEQRRCGTTDELLVELNASSRLIDCPRLTLVSMEGGTAPCGRRIASLPFWRTELCPTTIRWSGSDPLSGRSSPSP